MAATAFVGYATVALDFDRLTQLGVIGPTILGFFALIGKIIEVAATTRQQKLARQNRSGPSAVNAFVLGIVFAAAIVAFYFYNRPRNAVAGASAASTTVPITVDEASTVVSTYLQRVDADETIDQAWDMFTDGYQTEKTATQKGRGGFRNFWKSVDTVRATGELSVIGEPTATRIVVELPVQFNMIPELIAADKSPCSTEKDDFTIVRTNGDLQIDRAEISPGTFGVC